MGQFALLAPDGEVEVPKMTGLQTAEQSGSTLSTRVPIAGSGEFVAEFRNREIAFALKNVPEHGNLGLEFTWVTNQAAFQSIFGTQLNYRFRNFDYSLRITGGSTSGTPNGLKVVANRNSLLRLQMAQRICLMSALPNTELSRNTARNALEFFEADESVR